MSVTNYIWGNVSDNVLMETDGDASQTAEYQPDLFGELVSQMRSGEIRYYHLDGQESARELTDGNQQVTDAWLYSRVLSVCDIREIRGLANRSSASR